MHKTDGIPISLRKAAAEREKKEDTEDGERRRGVLGVYIKMWISGMDYCHEIPCQDQG